MNVVKLTRAVVVCSLIFGACCNAAAWHADGHVKATVLGLKLLENKVPAFFLTGESTIAHCCHDPDLFSSLPLQQLSRAEKPEHYIDMDLLKERPLPENRYEFLKLCGELKQEPQYVGMLPYAIAEWTQRLTIALAEHRRWPQDTHIQSKCLVFAGILSHYAGDACQPLHLSIHHDGRVDSSGRSPHTGIHQKVDALLGKYQFAEADLLQGLTVTSHRDTMKYMRDHIEENRQMVDTVYELESRLPDLKKSMGNDPRLKEFARDRMRSAAQIIACLFLSAWDNSALVEFPKWHNRTVSSSSSFK